MTHIAGHMPDDSCEWKEKGSKKCDKIHGCLHVGTKNGSFDPLVKVFLFNNDPNMPFKMPSLSKAARKNKTRLARAMQRRKVGFHVTLVGAPGANGKYIGAAHDVVDWKDHVNTEICVQAIERYRYLKIEEIPPIDLTTLALKLKHNVNDADTRALKAKFNKKYKPSERKKKGKEIIKIIEQSAAYLNSESYKIMLKGPDPHTWLDNNLWKFKDISKAMGKYA